MKPDDNRHGTSAGYVAGCREACCRAAIADYTRKLNARKYLHGPLVVSSLGSKRRIQALMALGWSTRLIDAELGKKRTYTTAILYGSDEMFRSTADQITAMYERLSMRLPPQTTSRERQVMVRSRNHAQRQGWSVPLAWDEGAIDDPNAHPYDYTPPEPTKPQRKRRTDVDENVVLAVLAGERRDTTPGEKQEIGRRWRAMGKPMAELARVTGWKKPERYGRSAA